MERLKYSAGAVSKGFWFEEFKKYNYLLKEGNDEKKIKELQEEKNILLAPSKSYGKKIIGEMSRRTKGLPDSVLEMFFNVDVSNQKLINLLGIMMTDRLFFEFIYEVYREEIIIGNRAFQDSKTRVFFKDKASQSEKVEGFSEVGKKRLAGAYKTYLRESNLLLEEDGILVYNKPILDLQLEEEMKNGSLRPYLKALTGVE